MEVEVGGNYKLTVPNGTAAFLNGPTSRLSAILVVRRVTRRASASVSSRFTSQDYDLQLTVRID